MTVAWTYRGAWDAAATYAPDEVVLSGNALWQAITPITGTPPTDAGPFVGGPTAWVSGTSTPSVAQALTITAAGAGTYTKVRARLRNTSGTATGTRIGFASAIGGDPASVSWLAYADVLVSGSTPVTGDLLEATLDTPLTLTAGQVIYAVVAGNGPSTSYAFPSSSTPVTGATVGANSIAQAGSSASAWSAGYDGVAGVQAVAASGPWRKLADLPDTSSLAAATRYRGAAWDSSIAYAPNDTVEYGNALWRAISPVAGSNPAVTAAAPTSGFIGGPNLGTGYAGYVAQAITFTAAGSYGHVRVGLKQQASGSLVTRVGFATALGASPGATQWLCYADITINASTTEAFYTAKLNAPLRVSAGQTVYAVVIKAVADGPIATTNTSAASATGVTMGAFTWQGAAGSAWTAASGQFVNVQVAAGTPAAWEKVADLPDTSAVAGKADRTTYRGAWAAATAYAKNDTVAEGNALWVARNPVTGSAPSAGTPSPAGGPATTDYGEGNAIAQAFTFATAATFTRIRVTAQTAGAVRVGLSASKPAGPVSVSWLAYADVNALANAYTEGVLSAPVTVAAGQTLWVVAVGDVPLRTGNSSRPMTGGVTVAATSLFTAGLKTAAAWDTTVWDERAAIQVVMEPWEKVADIPDISAVAGKADRTTYRGVWSAAATYAPNDTAESENALWRAIAPVTGTAPSNVPTVPADSAFTDGSSNILGSGYASYAAQQWTFSTGGTFRAIRAAVGSPGTIRVGFATSLPATPSEVSWLAYADLTSGASYDWSKGQLNTPLTVTAGQTVWLIAMKTTSGSTSISGPATSAASSVGQVSVAANSARYAGSNTDAWLTSLPGYVLTAQLAAGTSIPWEKVTDLGLQRRGTAAKTTASLADGASETGTITLATGYRLMKITTDKAARVRVYATAAQRDADVARAFGTDPTGDHGLLLDYQTTAGALSGTLNPIVDGASLEAAPSTAIPITITNKSGAAGTVTATLTYQRTE